MIRTAVTEALYPGFDGAQAETIMYVRFEGMAHDVCAVQLDARAMRWAAELSAVRGMIEKVSNAMHASMMA